MAHLAPPYAALCYPPWTYELNSDLNFVMFLTAVVDTQDMKITWYVDYLYRNKQIPWTSYDL